MKTGHTYRYLAISKWIRKLRSIDITISRRFSLVWCYCFGNYPFAFLLLSLSLIFIFQRCATGEAWNSIMLSCLHGDCDPLSGKEGQDCGSPLAYAYFVSFIFLCSFLVNQMNFGSNFLNIQTDVFCDLFRCWTYSLRSLWTISITWHVIPVFWEHIIWMNSYEYGENTTLVLSKFLKWLLTRISTCVQTSYSISSGRIHHKEAFDMLKNIDPPLGFGNKCPNRIAYKKLIRMNMPVDDDKKVNFTTTLFALIRENLDIKVRPGKTAHFK